MDTTELCCRPLHAQRRTTKAMYQLMRREDTGIRTSTARTRNDLTNQQQVAALRWTEVWHP